MTERSTRSGSTMEHNSLNDETYTVVARGIEVKCASIAQVVAAVNALTMDREVALPQATRERMEREGDTLDLHSAVEKVVAQAPRPLRPVEVQKAVRKLGVPARDATYHRVYAQLRYGEFERDGGRWSASA